MKTDFLYLCSSSKIRQKLLNDAHIPFISIPHEANEEIPFTTDFDTHVTKIAESKLESIVYTSLPHHPQTIFLLAADTLVYGLTSNTIYGKPSTHAAAITTIKNISQELLKVTTGCALARIDYIDGKYQKTDTALWASSATINFRIPLHEIESYLAHNPHALHAAGATTIEEYGSRYLASINGSYTAVLGLPLFEVIEALKKMNFNEKYNA